LTARRPRLEPTFDIWQPRQFLRPCVLLLLQESPAHGYDLLERLREFGLERDAGGLYRALRAMEHERLVVSEWETSTTGPDRRRYRPTRAGEARLQAWVGGLAEMRESLDRFLERSRSAAEQLGTG
jgi:poly-beta-hydroxybutyrate-responsive repressor